MDRQLNAILHAPAFQKLEASWRGLQFLVEKLPEDGTPVKIRVLNVTWAELARDVTNALEFDQSQLFRKVYEDEFGHPGGEPFGVLLGDYEIYHRPGPGHPHDDLEALGQIAGVAAAAFAPFVAAAHPSFFGLDSFGELERPLDLARTFEQVEYTKWRSLREMEDARFVGLALPRILMRRPYGPGGTPAAGTGFREEVGGTDHSRYLWGNPAFAFGAVLIRSFTNTGWMADIRGVRQGQDARGRKVCHDDGGLVAGLPVHEFGTDASGVVQKCSTEVIVTDAREPLLEDLGFIPLCHCQDTEFSAFYGSQSVQRPKKYDDPRATANARLSAMLQYILCVSQVSHYIKVIGRDLIGKFQRPEDCEDLLQKWLQNYTSANENAGPEVKARFPLREARVQVVERPDAPGTYACEIHLRPHFQLDRMYAAIKLTTQLAQARRA